MGQTYGIEAPQDKTGAGDPPPQPPARFLVLIDSASSAARQARLFGASREPLGRFDAGAPEVERMTQNLQPERSAASAAWDLALAGHSPQERAAADVYTLDV